MGGRDVSMRRGVLVRVCCVLTLSAAVVSCGGAAEDEGGAGTTDTTERTDATETTQVSDVDHTTAPSVLDGPIGTAEASETDIGTVPFDVDPARLGVSPADERCVDEGLREVVRAHPEARGLEHGEARDLTPAQHDELITIVAGVFTACIDIDTVKLATVDVALEQLGEGPELIACWTEAMDDEWYARYLADSALHGEADDVFHGQQLAGVLGCGHILQDQLLRDSGLPDEFFKCQNRINADLVADLEHAPERWRELTSEAAATARALPCLRELPASSPAGESHFAVSPERFGDAVVEELLAQTDNGPTDAQAACMAGAMIDGIGAANLSRSDPTAVEVVSYMRGVYSAIELDFELSTEQAEAIADGLLACVGSTISRMLTLNEGNILDALGRPDSPPDLGDLTACAVDDLDATVLREFLVHQFTDGPRVYLTTAGEALIDNSFEVVADCADELDIPHSPPQN